MIIQLNNLEFAYPNKPKQSVLNINQWTVAAEEHIFLHGPSGGGKSTLLNILCGMLKTSIGQVAVLGHELSNMSSRQRDQFRAHHIGYVFQQFNLIPYLNAIDNVLLAAYFGSQLFKSNTTSLTQEIETLLAQLNIDSKDYLKPTAQLSIGQQQRVAIARALINKPELLIADEPTSSLDQANRENFMAILMALAREHKTTLVFVSHDLSLAHHFNRVDSLNEINTAGDLS